MNQNFKQTSGLSSSVRRIPKTAIIYSKCRAILFDIEKEPFQILPLRMVDIYGMVSGLVEPVKYTDTRHSVSDMPSGHCAGLRGVWQMPAGPLSSCHIFLQGHS